MKKKETQKADYRWNKPVFLICVKAFFLFSFTGFILAVLTYFYGLLSRPVQKTSPAALAKAKNLNNMANNSMQLMRNIRSNDFDACRVLQIIAENLLPGIVLNDITIKPYEYSIKGYCASIDDTHVYVERLDFGKDWMINLDVIENRDGMTFWEISAKYGGKITK